MPSKWLTRRRYPSEWRAATIPERRQPGNPLAGRCRPELSQVPVLGDQLGRRGGEELTVALRHEPEARRDPGDSLR